MVGPGRFELLTSGWLREFLDFYMSPKISYKFNTLKGSGENVTELLKKVITVSAKYAPHFFSLALKFIE